MDLYDLISVNTGEIVSVFEWDGVSELEFPNGYTASLSTSSSIVNTPGLLYNDQFGGDFFGKFYASSDTSIVINGKTIENYVKQNNSSRRSRVKYRVTHPLELNVPLNQTGSYDNWIEPFTVRFNDNRWVTHPTTKIQLPNFPYPWNASRFDNISIFGGKFSWDNWPYYYLEFDWIWKGQFNLNKKLLVLRSEDYPNTFKKFKINSIKAYSPLFEQDILNGEKVYYLQPEFLLSEPLVNQKIIDIQTGNTVSKVIEDESIVNRRYFVIGQVGSPISGDVFDGLTTTTKHFAWLPVYTPGSQQKSTVFYCSPYFTQFDLDVQEIEVSTQDDDPSFDADPSKRIPLEGSLFFVEWEELDTEINDKRKIIHFVTSSTNITVPDWTEQITTICIGAGGGGGGGASGFAHSESIQYVQNLRDNENDVDGSPGSYTPGLNKPFGHEFVTGGGGGAGGNVVKNVIKGNFVKNNRGNSLSITVGSPGKGGIGSSYFNDVVATKYRLSQNSPENDRWKILKNTDYLFKVTMGIPISPVKPKQFDAIGAFDTDTPFYSLYSGITTMSPSGNSYNGGAGGNTFVELGGRTLASAQGGNGGTAGISIRDFAETYHLMCASPEHTPGLVMVPGGANSLDPMFNIGQEQRVGGPGGYGISMPTPRQTITLRQPHKQDSYIDELWEHTVNANKAINVPWIKDNSLGDDNANNVFPIGNTVRGNVSSADLYLKYNSNGYDIPTKPAPTGGGGGCGALWNAFDRRDASIYSNDYVKHNTIVHRYGIPNDWFQVLANLITGSISLGLGGTNTVTEYLINESDAFGNFYSYELNSTGSHGGYGRYGIDTDNKLSPNGIPYQDLEPEPGKDFGYGGGGGAGRYVLNHNDKFRTDDEVLYPTKGQDGADGGRGLAIIIFE